MKRSRIIFPREWRHYLNFTFYWILFRHPSMRKLAFITEQLSLWNAIDWCLIVYFFEHVWYTYVCTVYFILKHKFTQMTHYGLLDFKTSAFRCIAFKERFVISRFHQLFCRYLIYNFTDNWYLALLLHKSEVDKYTGATF